MTPVCKIVVRAPGQLLEVERAAEPLADGLEHLDRFGGDVLADAVAGDDCDLVTCKLSSLVHLSAV